MAGRKRWEGGREYGSEEERENWLLQRRKDGRARNWNRWLHGDGAARRGSAELEGREGGGRGTGDPQALKGCSSPPTLPPLHPSNPSTTAWAGPNLGKIGAAGGGSTGLGSQNSPQPAARSTSLPARFRPSHRPPSPVPIPSMPLPHATAQQAGGAGGGRAGGRGAGVGDWKPSGEGSAGQRLVQHWCAASLPFCVFWLRAGGLGPGCGPWGLPPANGRAQHWSPLPWCSTPAASRLLRLACFQTIAAINRTCNHGIKIERRF